MVEEPEKPGFKSRSKVTFVGLVSCNLNIRVNDPLVGCMESSEMMNLKVGARSLVCTEG